MYGCNKLYCEQLGRYYARYYKQLAAEPQSAASTSAACGFPGLISALTVPSGGTSDYAPEMIHAAAQGRAVRLLRPAGHADSVHGDARRRRGAADAGGGAARALTRTAYNLARVQSDRPTRSATRCCARFPTPRSRWQIDVKRQGIVDSWPADVDDTAARRDWGFAPGLRLRARVPRIPDSDDSSDIQIGHDCHLHRQAWGT